MARRLLQLLLALIVVALLVAGAGLAYLFLALPRSAPPSDLQVLRTPERIARGEYLSRHVAGCVVCHGERDWTKYSGPHKPESAGHASAPFLIDVGRLIAPNLSPVALASWTDGELLRAMKDGVSKDGSPLFPLMPYENYREMAQEDAEAIIAYIRTLAPSHTQPPRSALKFPLSLIVRTIPHPSPPLRATRPPTSDRLAYGRYMTTIASCTDCHTKRDQGQALPGMAFAGGMDFRTPSGDLHYSANITPDMETGIGRWSEEQFIERFKNVADAPAAELALNGRRNTDMPWRDFGGMTREDLGAIYTYLRTVPAVRHVVPRIDAPATPAATP